MKRTIIYHHFLAALILFFALPAFAQETINALPSPSQTPPPVEETIKVSTEEVHLNVLARSAASGKFVSTLKAEDLLVVEDGTPQEIIDLQRIPANVLLLLDTGAELNFAKNVKATQLIAEIFVRSLPPNNSLSVMQYYDKTETLADWSNDYQTAIEALNTKIFTGRRSRLTDALNAAVESFRTRPLENRHLVLISDGVETVADDAERRKALQNLLAANITVHVISFTQLEQQQAQASTQRLRLGDGKAKPKIDPIIYDQIIRSLPMGENGQEAEKLRARLRAMNEAQPLVIVNFDQKMIKKVRERMEIWKESEANLESLAADTGGIFQAPEDSAAMLTLALEIAKAVDSQYVITYIPKKPFANSPGKDEAENRKVRVSTHLEGIEIKSRQKIVFNPAPNSP